MNVQKMIDKEIDIALLENQLDCGLSKERKEELSREIEYEKLAFEKWMEDSNVCETDQ